MCVRLCARARCVYMYVLSMYVRMLCVNECMYVVCVFIVRLCMLCVMEVCIYECTYTFLTISPYMMQHWLK